MTNLTHLFSCSVAFVVALFFSLTVQSQSQIISLHQLGPQPLTECDSILVTVNGNHPFNNTVIDSAIVDYQGGVPFFTIYADTVGTGTPSTIPFLLTGNYGLFNWGTYSYAVEYIFLGATIDFKDSAFFVDTCCNAQVDVGFTMSSDTICPNELLTLTNNSTNTGVFRWKLEEQFFSTATDTGLIINTPGLYEIELIAGLGTCKDSITKSIFVIGSAPIFIVPNSDTAGVCTTVPLSANNDFPSYRWTYNGNVVAEGPNAKQITSSNEGYYTLEIEDSGCTVRDSILVLNSPMLLKDESIVESTCFACNDGSITLILDGGTEPYNYEWSNLDTTNPLLNLFGLETYTVTITDLGTCEIIDSFYVDGPLGISKSAPQADFKIYPQPATNELFVNWEAPTASGGTIVISALDGRQLNKYTVIGNTTTLSVGHLQHGLYLLEWHHDRAVRRKVFAIR